MIHFIEKQQTIYFDILSTAMQATEWEIVWLYLTLRHNYAVKR